MAKYEAFKPANVSTSRIGKFAERMGSLYMVTAERPVEHESSVTVQLIGTVIVCSPNGGVAEGQGGMIIDPSWLLPPGTKITITTD